MACASTLRDIQFGGTLSESLKPSADPPREPGALCALSDAKRRDEMGLLGALPTLFSTMLCKSYSKKREVASHTL